MSHAAYSDFEIGVARALHEIERTRFECPECHSGIPRPNCFVGLGPDCPGMEAAGELEDLKNRVRRMLPGKNERYRHMPKAIKIRPPTDAEREALAYMAENGHLYSSHVVNESGERVAKWFARLRTPSEPSPVLMRLVHLGVATMGSRGQQSYVEMSPFDIVYAQANGVDFGVPADARANAESVDPT